MQLRRNGTDPIINEDMLVEALDVTVKSDTIQQVQSGAFMLVLDAWDRKVTRDQFIAALGASQSLVDAVARVSLMMNVKKAHARNGGLSDVDIETALHGCHDTAKTANVECLKMVHLLKQCPLSEDPIH